MKRLSLMLMLLALLGACAPPGGEADPAPAPAPEHAALYRQLALYIRQGLTDYRLPGKYTLSFGPLEEERDYFRALEGESLCAVVVEGGDGLRGGGYYSVGWDEEADWYGFHSLSEPFLSGDEGYCPEVDPVWTLEIDTEAPAAEVPRFDTPPVPVETVTDHQDPFRTGGDFHRETYHYVDQRRGLDVMADYPQIGWVRGWDTEGVEKTVDDLLRQAAVEAPFDFGGDYDVRKNENGATEGTYQITREDEKYLSVRFYSYWDFRWAAHPSWGERGVTVDRETGRRLALTDVVDFDGDGGALIRRYDWTPQWTWEGNSAGDEVEFLAGAFVDWGENGYLEDFYLTEDKLGLIVRFGRYYTCIEAGLDSLPLKLEL